MRDDIRRKVSLAAGILLILLGGGFLAYVGLVTYTWYRFFEPFGGTIGPMTWDSWAVLLSPVIAIAAGIFLVFRARRRP
jgi:hypothetical protein